jgi:hypothetical protein
MVRFLGFRFLAVLAVFVLCISFSAILYIRAIKNHEKLTACKYSHDNSEQCHIESSFVVMGVNWMWMILLFCIPFFWVAIFDPLFLFER